MDTVKTERVKPATPLPWELSNKFARDKVYEGGLLVANCHVESDLRPKAACEQNAAYIATACNAYPDLLAACRLTLRHMHAEELDAPTAAELEHALHEAIAKAEGVTL